LKLPVVCNTHGFESLDLLKALEGIVDIYLPDMKYGTDESARALSGVADYPRFNRAALREMVRQVGRLKTDGQQIAYRGVLVRHLVLPGNLGETAAVLQELLEISPRIPLSLMSQYRPCHEALDHPVLQRRLTGKEYQEALDSAEQLGFEEVYSQELDSAEVYFPDFQREDPFGPKENQ
jgi:putative pyruvate formate lyase activating enzyme